MNLFSKIFSVFKNKDSKLSKSQMRELVNEVKKARQRESLDKQILQTMMAWATMVDFLRS